MKRIIVFMVLLFVSFTLIGCSNSPNYKVDDISIKNLIEKNNQINELYYESDVPYEVLEKALEPNKGIHKKSQVWIKDSNARVEDSVYQDDTLIYTMGTIYGEEGVTDDYYKKFNDPKIGSISRPLKVGKEEYTGIRSKTILGIVDKLNLNNAEIVGVEKVNKEDCGIVKVDSESIDTLWIGLNTGMVHQIKYKDKYLITYNNVKVGTGAVSDKDLVRPNL